VRQAASSHQIAAPHACCASVAESATGGYVAATVTGNGELRMGPMSSLWFGCVVDAPAHGVSIGARSNVQDNSLLRAAKQPIIMGEDCTIGHNVLLNDCSIGARVLIGMGSTLAPGTVVMDDVLVAAGSMTLDAQVLESGWLWGGRPARPISRLDDRKYQIIRASAAIYCEYARDFARATAENHSGIL
ncbi:MAG: gamma carbonic anhydrase family protein, partial [Betaproteobacteria bacterium]